MRALTQIGVHVSDLDHVPVPNQPDDAGIPGGERPAAKPRRVSKGQTRQEKHSTMSSSISKPQQTGFTKATLKRVHVYSVYSCSFVLFE